MAEPIVAAGTDTSRPAAADDRDDATVPLTPIQRWFLTQPLTDRHHWNQAVLLRVDADGLSAEQWRTLVAALLAHQRRAAIARAADSDRVGADVWRFCPISSALPAAAPFEWIDLRAVAPAERAAAITAAATALQRTFDLRTGPLLRVACLHLGGGEPDRLLVIVHHLAVDGVSWRILLDDLADRRAATAARRADRLGGQDGLVPGLGTRAHGGGGIINRAGGARLLEHRRARYHRRAARPRGRRRREPRRHGAYRHARAQRGADDAVAAGAAGGVARADPGSAADGRRRDAGGLERTAHRVGGCRRPRARRPRGGHARPVAHGGLVHDAVSGASDARRRGRAARRSAAARESAVAAGAAPRPRLRPAARGAGRECTSSARAA